jgi:hypothetical protein
MVDLSYNDADHATTEESLKTQKNKHLSMSNSIRMVTNHFDEAMHRITHTWPEKSPSTLEEIDEMLHNFDTDGDGQFSVGEVRAMALQFVQTKQSNRQLRMGFCVVLLALMIYCGVMVSTVHHFPTPSSSPPSSAFWFSF